MSLKDLFESSEVLTIIMFGLALAFILALVIPIFKRWDEDEKNAKKPIETKHAKVVSKRNIMDNKPDLGTLILFEFDDGSRQEFAVNTSIAPIIIENDVGNLTYQGSKFMQFERNIDSLNT